MSAISYAAPVVRCPYCGTVNVASAALAKCRGCGSEFKTVARPLTDDEIQKFMAVGADRPLPRL
jgi:DNA-directed RNA polymerase subunit RPC12/RpoP